MKQISKSVLIVDDVSKNIQVIANFLQKEGYSINFAQSGKEALEHTKRHAFDLILLDIMMPEMNGFEVIKTLKQNEYTGGIPIIFITAKTDTESITRGFELGAVDYITKPFNGVELVARIKTHINLKQKEIQLNELLNTKDRILSIIGHDLKNPFHNILGLTELLNNNYKNFDEPELKDIYESIQISAKQGYNLLENLLNWSGIQTGKISYKPKELILNDIIKENLDLFKINIESKNIIINIDIPPLAKIYCDENMINTVIRNIISNAIKFSFNQGEIHIHAIKKNNDIEVTISDNGVGISEENMSKLFNIDKKITTPGTENEKGTGLGLILCKELVEIQGGKLEISSKENKGTTIRFTLPSIPQ